MVRIFGDHVSAEVRMSQPEQALVHYTGGRTIRLHPDWADTTAKPGVYQQDVSFLRSVVSGRPAVPPASDLRDHVATIELVERLRSPR